MKPNRALFLMSAILPMTIAVGLLAYMAWLIVGIRVGAWIDSKRNQHKNTR